MIERSHHDMGGRPAGPVVPSEHDYAEWERRIDAMAVLLFGIKGGPRRFSVDEHRRAIESLPPLAYDTLTYYEKWIVALTQCALQRGLITTNEVAHKMAEVEKRAL